MAINRSECVIYILEFKTTMDLRPSFQANAEARATRQHKWLAQTLAKVGARSDWKVQVVVFTGGTPGSVEIERFENNLKLLTSKRKNGPISESYMPEHFWRPMMRSYERTMEHSLTIRVQRYTIGITHHQMSTFREVSKIAQR